MKRTTVIIILLFMQLGCSIGFAMSCRSSELTLEESQVHLGAEKYSPFSTMKATSFIGGIAGVIALGSEEANRGESQIPDWVTGTAVLWWSASALIMMSDTCPVKLHPDASAAKVTRSEAVTERLKGLRQSFYALHLFNSIPLLLATPYSNRSDRAPILLGGILLPAVVDVIYRNLFARDQVSPWTFQPGIVMNDRGPTGVLALSYTW